MLFGTFVVGYIVGRGQQPRPRAAIPSGFEIVPDLVGRKEARAGGLLAGVGLEDGLRQLVQSDRPLFEVVGQIPRPGTALPFASTVDLVLSGGESAEVLGADCPATYDLVPSGRKAPVAQIVNRFHEIERLSEPSMTSMWDLMDPYLRATNGWSRVRDVLPWARRGAPHPGDMRFRYQIETPVRLTSRVSVNAAWQLRRAGLDLACTLDQLHALVAATWWVGVLFPDCPCASGGEDDFLVVHRRSGYEILSMT